MVRAATLSPDATDSFHVTLTVFVVSTSPPLGEVTVAVGRWRPSSHWIVRSRTPLRTASGLVGGTLIPVNSWKNAASPWKSLVVPKNSPYGVEAIVRMPKSKGPPKGSDGLAKPSVVIAL
jgi:hypothetical protein